MRPVTYITYTVEDPAHGAVTSTSEHPEIRDIVEKVEPEEREEFTADSV